MIENSIQKASLIIIFLEYYVYNNITAKNKHFVIIILLKYVICKENVSREIFLKSGKCQEIGKTDSYDNIVLVLFINIFSSEL